MGMAFYSIDVIINVFLGKLGANYLMLAILPACWAMGGFIPPVLAGYFTQNLRKKKGLVIFLHFLLPIFVLGCGLFIYFGSNVLYSPEGPNRALIWGTIGIMALYWLATGLIMPIYVNFINKVLYTTARGLSFGSIFAAQCIFGVLGTYFAAHILAGAASKDLTAEIVARYGLCFTIGAGIILVGNLFFFPIKELDDVELDEPVGFGAYISSFFRIFFREKNLKYYTLSRYFILSYVVFIYFYPKYLSDNYAWSKPDTLVMLAIFGFIGQAIGYFVSGLLSTRLSYKRIAILGNIVLIGAIVFFLVSNSLANFYIVAFLVGAFLGNERFYNYNLVMEICKKEDKTKYLVLAMLLQAPAMAAAVLLGGIATDNLAYLFDIAPRNSFMYVTVAAGALMVAGTIMLQFMVKTDRKPGD
jgi:predicted MFS family arabinose efflux permease